MVFNDIDKLSKVSDEVFKLQTQHYQTRIAEMNNNKHEIRFDIDPLDLNRLKRQERAAKLIEERKLRESKKQVVQFEMQLAGPNDDISEILSRNLFQQHKPLVCNRSELRPDFDEDMLCKCDHDD